MMMLLGSHHQLLWALTTHAGLHELSGPQLQDLHKEYRLMQPVGEKYEEFQRLRQEVGELLASFLTPQLPKGGT